MTALTVATGNDGNGRRQFGIIGRGAAPAATAELRTTMAGPAAASAVQGPPDSRGNGGSSEAAARTAALENYSELPGSDWRSSTKIGIFHMEAHLLVAGDPTATADTSIAHYPHIGDDIDTPPNRADRELSQGVNVFVDDRHNLDRPHIGGGIEFEFHRPHPLRASALTCGGAVAFAAALRHS